MCLIHNSPKLKHKIDRYVRYGNIDNVVLFAKTSIARVLCELSVCARKITQCHAFQTVVK